MFGVDTSKQNPPFIYIWYEWDCFVQQIIQESKADDFKINPKYQQAVPRPTYDEMRALDESLRLNGQMYPITVNNNMVILDGHSRFEALSTRGALIKYQVFQSSNDEDEFRFVVESNIMKRNLNTFQKIETMYEFIKAEREKKQVNNYDNRVEVINAIKNGKVKALDIGREIGINTQSTNRILVGMVDDFILRRTKKTSEEKRPYYAYELLPKAEEVLVQSVRKRKITISRLIGVSVTTMHMGVFLIENADTKILNALRVGQTTISAEYHKMNKTNDTRKFGRNTHETYFRCPNCKHTYPRSKYQRKNYKEVSPEYR